ncbi:MAG TPA: gamma-glutamyltransferase [Candidatus Acidoferrales bacterium]|nr:gamma-glutamyltransferase [Candidatus Acidoferrales bacterium]
MPRLHIFTNACRTLLLTTALTLGLAMTSPEMHGQDRGQGRSMVISQGGVVAAESPLAGQAGVAILQSGGNAVDAAIAANAVMGVVAPMSNGIGGDLFAIIYDAKSGKLYGMNASGWAPAALNAEMLRQKGFRAMPLRGIYSVTVPGAVDGWQKMLERFGHKKLADVLAPAIHVADQGFPVTEWVSNTWTADANVVRGDDEAARVYLNNGQPMKVGQVFRNPDLAASLRQIATGGRDAFYKGEIARRIVDASKRHDGVMTLDDLAGYSAEWVEPISTTYRGWTVYEMPPNGQGVAALEMLNIMETFPLADFGGPTQTRTLHAMIEAKKLAYADLQKYIGDPRNNPQVMHAATGMLSKAYAAQRAKLIDMEKANCEVSAGDPNALPPGGDTIYLSVVDAEGNMVSLIQSNYEHFGSGLMAQGTGFILHDRGALFNLDPGSPNELAGHKRPLHTIIPAFMEKGDTRVAFGIMGGWNQAQAHAQFVSHIVDYKQNIQQSMETARFTKGTFTGCDVLLENRIPGNVRAELTAKGHILDMHNGFSDLFGGGQAVMRDFATGVNYGASDPRKDGAAIPQLKF